MAWALTGTRFTDLCYGFNAFWADQLPVLCLRNQRPTVRSAATASMPKYLFPGLVPGDRWCVTARNWLRAYQDGCAAPVVLASTHERTLDVVPLAVLREHAVDVPDDLTGI